MKRWNGTRAEYNNDHLTSYCLFPAPFNAEPEHLHAARCGVADPRPGIASTTMHPPVNEIHQHGGDVNANAFSFWFHRPRFPFVCPSLDVIHSEKKAKAQDERRVAVHPSLILRPKQRKPGGEKLIRSPLVPDTRGCGHT